MTETATIRPRRRTRDGDWTLGPAKWLAAGVLGGAGLVGLAWVMTSRTPAPLLAQTPPPLIIEPETAPHQQAAETRGGAVAQEEGEAEQPPAEPEPDRHDPIAEPGLSAVPEAAPSTLTPFIDRPARERPATARTTPEPEPPVRERAPVSIAVRINVNTADAAQLDLLPGIGPVIAERIIEERRVGGPFRTLRDLERVRGIGPKTVDKLAAHVRFE